MSLFKSLNYVNSEPGQSDEENNWKNNVGEFEIWREEHKNSRDNGQGNEDKDKWEGDVFKFCLDGFEGFSEARPNFAFLGEMEVSYESKIDEDEREEQLEKTIDNKKGVWTGAEDDCGN